MSLEDHNKVGNHTESSHMQRCFPPSSPASHDFKKYKERIEAICFVYSTY